MPHTPSVPPLALPDVSLVPVGTGQWVFWCLWLLTVFLYHLRYFPFLCLSDSTWKLSDHLSFPLTSRMILFSSSFYSVWFYLCHSIHHLMNWHHLSLVVLVFPSKQKQDPGKDWFCHSVYLLLLLCFSPSRCAVKICWIKVVSRNKNKNHALFARAGRMKYHRLGGLNSRNVFAHSSGG